MFRLILFLGFFLLFPFLIGMKALGQNPDRILPADSPEISQTNYNEQKLLTGIEINPNVICDMPLEELMDRWSEKSMSYKDFLAAQKGFTNNPNCAWTQLSFYNPDSSLQRRFLQFPGVWPVLECFIPANNGHFKRQTIGMRNRLKTIDFWILPKDTLRIYIKYPKAPSSIGPILRVQEMSEETVMRLRSREKFKYFLLGIIIFPILFFMFQTIIERDPLNLAYLIFLFGAGANLLTILDTIPFFSLCPNILPSMSLMARIFVLSCFLTLAGLVKYIHHLLEVRSWPVKLYHIGNILLLAFLLVIIFPFLKPSIFTFRSYEGYLSYFRILALLVFVYVIVLCVGGLLVRAKFIRPLLLAFSPFILSGSAYALSFIYLGNYSKNSIVSLIFVACFFLTLLLFGVILGIRNNLIKTEKIQLEQESDHLKQMDQFKSRFYTNISHEFRTPLTVIKGMADQIKGQEKIKALISRNSKRLIRLVDQLLDLSRAENNSLTINWVNSDVIPYLQYLTESCHSLSDQKNLNLAFFSPEKSLIMDFDEQKMEQILINLISNAIKFTPAYGSVKVMANKITRNYQPFLELKVQDTGYGISKDKLPHIFDRFYQVDNSSTRKEEGSGIGLSLVKELVQILDGQITVDSKINKGTVFNVHLPIYNKADKKTPSTTPIPESVTLREAPDDEVIIATSYADKDKPQILVIEDNTDVAAYIVSCLMPQYTVDSSRNGLEGLKKAQEIIPDAIICDVMMPEMDGFEVCRHLKSDQRTSHIPIILLTARAAQEDKKTGLLHGADAYLTKPFDKEELLIRLDMLYQKSQLLKEYLSKSSENEHEKNPLLQQEAKFLQQVDQIIIDHLNDELFDTQFLCRALTMSRTQLHRKLKALTNQSTASYIRSKRLKKAWCLLEETDMPIGDIAFEVGYKDFSHFSRSFLKEFGIQPNETRK